MAKTIYLVRYPESRFGEVEQNHLTPYGIQTYSNVGQRIRDELSDRLSLEEKINIFRTEAYPNGIHKSNKDSVRETYDTLRKEFSPREIGLTNEDYEREYQGGPSFATMVRSSDDILLILAHRFTLNSLLRNNNMKKIKYSARRLYAAIDGKDFTTERK